MQTTYRRDRLVYCVASSVGQAVVAVAVVVLVVCLAFIRCGRTGRTARPLIVPGKGSTPPPPSPGPRCACFATKSLLLLTGCFFLRLFILTSHLYAMRPTQGMPLKGMWERISVSLLTRAQPPPPSLVAAIFFVFNVSMSPKTAAAPSSALINPFAKRKVLLLSLCRISSSLLPLGDGGWPGDVELLAAGTRAGGVRERRRRRFAPA